MTRNEHVTNKKTLGITAVYKYQKHLSEVMNLGNWKSWKENKEMDFGV